MGEQDSRSEPSDKCFSFNCKSQPFLHPPVAGFGMSHLDGLEGLVSVLQVEIDRVLEQEHALVKVLDDDGGGDGDGEVIGLQVDVLLAVGPQQGRSQQREPEGPRHISRQFTKNRCKKKLSPQCR